MMWCDFSGAHMVEQRIIELMHHVSVNTNSQRDAVVTA